MAKADAWQTQCPECKARLRLPVTVRQGPKIPGQQAVAADVTVDVGPMREHMRDKHPERYPDQ